MPQSELQPLPERESEVRHWTEGSPVSFQFVAMRDDAAMPASEPRAAATRTPAYVSVGVVAAEFGVHPNTVRNWEARGLIRAARLPGGHRRFLASEVETLHATLWGTVPPMVASEDITLVPAEAVEPHQRATQSERRSSASSGLASA